jgi:hypothetical protein
MVVWFIGARNAVASASMRSPREASLHLMCRLCSVTTSQCNFFSDFVELLLLLSTGKNLTLQKTHAETTASIEKFLEAGTALVQNGRQSPQAGEQPEKAIIKDRQIEVRLFACWRMLILRDLVPPVQGSWHAFHRATFARVEGWNAEGKERHRQSWESDLFVVCHGSGTGASSCAQASRWFLPCLMPSQDFSGMPGTK